MASGEAVADALEELGDSVRRIDPTVRALEDVTWESGDVALLALHGPGGEDGTVQEILTQLGVTFTGCDVQASKKAFVKSEAKRSFRASGVTTPDWVLLERDSDLHDVLRLARLDQVAWSDRLVVKPDAQGSSLGVTLVETPAEFSTAVASAFVLGDRVLVERAVAGPEWTVALVDDAWFPPLRIGAGQEIFDFEAKYSGSPPIDAPPVLSGSTAEAVVLAACAACQSLGTRGLVRVDLREDELGTPHVLEVNSIPGLTDHSLVPAAARLAGWSLGEVARMMIASALLGPRLWHIRQDRSSSRPGDPLSPGVTRDGISG